MPEQQASGISEFGRLRVARRDELLATEPQKALAQKIYGQHRSCTDILISNKRGLHRDRRSGRLFLRAMKEAFAHHYLGSEAFQRLCAQAQFFPWSLKREEQLCEIPYFFVTALKYREVRSVPSESIALTLRSSGTGGQTSAIYLDRSSLRRIKRVVRSIYSDLGLSLIHI